MSLREIDPVSDRARLSDSPAPKTPRQFTPSSDCEDSRTRSLLKQSTVSTASSSRHASHPPSSTPYQSQIQSRTPPTGSPSRAPSPSPEPTTTIEIHLPLVARGRRHKVCPPLAPLSLLPLDDSTAYIVEKRVEKFAKDHENVIDKYVTNKKKYHENLIGYVVGWTDIPGARALVRASEISDYVSPRAYEAYANRCREEQREQLEQAKANNAEHCRNIIKGNWQWD